MMTSKTGAALRFLTGTVFAAVCGSALLLGTLSPATAGASERITATHGAEPIAVGYTGSKTDPAVAAHR